MLSVLSKEWTSAHNILDELNKSVNNHFDLLNVV